MRRAQHSRYLRNGLMGLGAAGTATALGFSMYFQGHKSTSGESGVTYQNIPMRNAMLGVALLGLCGTMFVYYF